MPTLTFRQGDGYSGTIDVTIRESTPNSAPSEGLGLFVTNDSGGASQVLLAFTGLFGSGPGQIPYGAVITSATLTLRITDETTTGVSISRMLVDWPEDSSWNSLVNGVQLDEFEATASPDLIINNDATGFREFDVTSSLLAWLSGATSADEANEANDGWVFTALGTDLFAFRSSESAGVPVLTVTYTMPGGELGLAGPVTQAEGTSDSLTPFVFTVTRSGDADSAVSVDYAIIGSGSSPAGGSDFAGGVLPSGTVTFLAGETSKTITVNVVADSMAEPNENFTVTLSGATGSSLITSGTALGTIVDDDGSGGGTGEVIGVRVYDASGLGPGVGSTDPTDIAYDPATGLLYVTDSEVDEKPFYSQNNLFKMSGEGDPLQSYSLRSFSSEPTGVAVWQNRLYISDDNNKMIYVVDKDDPSVLVPGLSFSTTLFNIADPEDLSVNLSNGNLFILNERNKTIYEIEFTSNGPRVVDQTVLPSPFTTKSNGAEGLVYDVENDWFYVCAGRSSNIYVVSRSGVLLDTIDVLSQFPNDGGYRVFPKGLELAPASDGSGNLSLWVTDYGKDQVADGRLFEIILDRSATSFGTASQPFTSLEIQSTAATTSAASNSFGTEVQFRSLPDVFDLNAFWYDAHQDDWFLV